MKFKILKKIFKCNEGFTLVETLVYITIFALVSSALIGFVVSVVDIDSKNYSKQEVDANGRMAIEFISDKIREASDVYEGQSTFNSDPGVLSLKISDVLKDPTIINLSQNDGVLQIKEGLDDPVAITTDKVKVTNLIFRNYTSGQRKNCIKIEMTLEYNANSDDVEYQYSKTIQTSITLRR